MSGPITLSAADFAAVLEAAGLDPATTAPPESEAPGTSAGSGSGSEASTAETPATGAEAEAGFGSGAGAAGGAGPEPEGAPATPGGPGPNANPGAVPDPFDDADALEELEHEVVTLAAHIEAATYRLLVLIAEFDRRRGWELGGHRSCAHWLHYVTGIDLGAAREKVRAARALKRLPRTSEAMANGELSFSKVRALTRVATPECEEELLEAARSFTTAGLERFVREWRSLSRADEEVLERARYESRGLSVFPDDDGMHVVKGRVSAEVGALLMRAVEAAADVLFCREATEETTAKQRRADALGLLAERAMAAGFGGSGSGRKGAGAKEAAGLGGGRNGRETAGADTDGSAKIPVSEARDEQEAAGAGADTDVSAERSISRGTRAERYQVFLHVEPDTLRSGDRPGAVAARAADDGDPPEPGRSHLEDGTRLAPETARRLCCDVAMVTVARGDDGSVLDIGRRSRVIPPAIDRAVRIRDGGYCRFPGCTVRFTDGHHVIHWADGGTTSLDNLLSLCVYHHRKLHEGGWRLQYDAADDVAVFVDPRGHVRYDARPRTPAPLFEDMPGADGAGAAADSAPPEEVASGARPEEVASGAAAAGAPEVTAAAGDVAIGVHAAGAPEVAAAAGDVATGLRAAGALAELNRARGVEPDGEKLRARYRRECDVPWETLAPSLEALDEAHFGG